MTEHDVDRALKQVRQMHELVLDRQGFRGFSGVARMAGGAAALLTALMMRHAVPPEPNQHLVGWGLLLAFGLAVNFAALFWCKSCTGARCVTRSLGGVGGVSDALGGCGRSRLSGPEKKSPDSTTCCSASGLRTTVRPHMAHRRSLPFPIYAAGWAYLSSVIFFLPVAPWRDLHRPAPIGTCYFIGDLFGGGCLYGRI
jgi:drug/metabolite transporter (DMT)-like permease